MTGNEGGTRRARKAVGVVYWGTALTFIAAAFLFWIWFVVLLWTGRAAPETVILPILLSIVASLAVKRSMNGLRRSLADIENDTNRSNPPR